MKRLVPSEDGLSSLQRPGVRDGPRPDPSKTTLPPLLTPLDNTKLGTAGPRIATLVWKIRVIGLHWLVLFAPRSPMSNGIPIGFGIAGQTPPIRGSLQAPQPAPAAGTSGRRGMGGDHCPRKSRSNAYCARTRSNLLFALSIPEGHTALSLPWPCNRVSLSACQDRGLLSLSLVAPRCRSSCQSVVSALPDAFLLL